MAQKTLLNQLVDSLTCLPGVGKKSAQRMAFHLLDKNRDAAINLSTTLRESMLNIKNCQSCRDYTESEICVICKNNKRDETVLCIVESPSDVVAIESTAGFNGKFFVLLGQLSPLDGIGPDEIGIPLLIKQLEKGQVREIIIATSSTVEGEATAHYIAQLSNRNLESPIQVTRLAQGVPVGGELGYLDQSTLALSLANRSQFDS